MAEETDIVVVGGGPAGLIAAREASKEGAHVRVFEEDREIGIPCHCAGLVSLKGLEEIDVVPNKTFVQNKVRGAVFYSPSGLSFKIERKETVAYVVNRPRFDQFLAQQATKAGVEISVGSNVQTVRRLEENKGIEIKVNDRETFRAKVLVDAEGASSRIMRIIGLKPLKSASLLPGVQLELKDVNVDPYLVEIHTGNKIAPNFFAWVIPLDRDSARVGLACRGLNPRLQLEKFVCDRFTEKRKIEPNEIRSGLIITCGPVQKTFDDNFLTVGDAAGQVKPTTGGGVILGGICAKIAGRIAAVAIKENDSNETFLRAYETSWKKRLGQEFRTTKIARRVLNHLDDKTLDKLFKAVMDENLQREFSYSGDMDFQRGVILKLLRKKEVLGVLPSVIGSLFPFTRKTKESNIADNNLEN